MNFALAGGGMASSFSDTYIVARHKFRTLAKQLKGVSTCALELKTDKGPEGESLTIDGAYRLFL